MVAASQFCIAYVTVDVLCLVLTIIIASNVSRDSGSETQIRYFNLLLLANFVFDIFDALWAILVFGQTFQAPEAILSIVNGINLASIAFAGYFWFCFSLAHFESNVTNERRLTIIAAIPALLVIPLHIIGYFTNQNVIFTPDGDVAYGLVHTIAALIAVFYLVAATAVAISKYRHSTTRAQHNASLVFIMFMVAPATSGIIDSFIPDMPVAAAGIMISIVFVMMALQKTRISNDALTGLNNRRSAESFLEDRIPHATAEHPLYLFIVDMDRFKSINDTYGHLEGDHALRLMAEALRRVCTQANAFAARWGGDEFVLICAETELASPKTVSELIQNMLAKVAQDSRVNYDLSCSVGYAVCESASKDRTRLVSDADKMLYRNKQSLR